MIILGIESSCDETSAAICCEGKIINNVIATQTVHKRYGGVVPELASRAHQQNIVPVVSQALDNANVSINEITGISYTQGPGLLGALLVGSSFAKSVAFAMNVPLVPVHHLHAHILAHFIENPVPKFPFLCLTVSGGHTQIVKVSSYLEMEIMGQTKDDAVGEAFDKCAKMLGLPYPGGPMIDKLAKYGNSEAFTFSETDMPNLDYSFSGIKTSVLYFLRDQVKDNKDFISENLNDLCASIQKTLVKMLMNKFLVASKELGIDQLAIAGGVAANSELRNVLLNEINNGCEVYIPKFEYCTDNAAMIAMAGHLAFEAGFTGELHDSPKPRMPF
ncbi:MAG: tRNA (adenosine(37)-N6)-threonylcarbamoyltransferase complex transferase subunit TsaD [Cytophagales bacterium]|nr:tRNA (adenosine(37)-N6)-threonylcarbamoyltransferase complex transferase subunit TsaD [Cytophagales bacterium]